MSKRGYRTKFARDLAKHARKLGYDIGWTATGHLRFSHPSTGAVVIGPSTAGGHGSRLGPNARAELARGIAAEKIGDQPDGK